MALNYHPLNTKPEWQVRISLQKTLIISQIDKELICSPSWRNHTLLDKGLVARGCSSLKECASIQLSNREILIFCTWNTDNCSFFLWKTFKFSLCTANISLLPIRPHEFTWFIETSVRKNHHLSTQLFSGHNYYPATRLFLVSKVTLHITPLAIL